MIATASSYVPPLWSVVPFVALLLVIALAPLVPACAHWWHSNRNKLLVSLALSVPVVLYYLLVHPAWTIGEGGAARQLAPGLPVLGHALHGALLEEYFPFMALLLSLYIISGGIQIRGDLRARPATNTAFLAAGTVLANLIGTTGAAVLLIRPLLATNAERRRVTHTVVFFIIMVCNTGGCLLPIGDPPLFLGYLMGVPFLWTLHLAAPWAAVNAALLAIYHVWDRRVYRKEVPRDIARDAANVEGLSIRGGINIVYLLGVVMSAVMLAPGRPVPLLKGAVVPDMYLREIVMLLLAAASMLTTPRGLRGANGFTFAAIAEVAALFLGIFITMQAPIEILRAMGPSLGLTEPWQFFWATGALSSFLDNAPTYVVFLQTANSLTSAPGPGILVLWGGDYIRADLLTAVSLGSVFMGAMTYIGNGPNFMVKAIAQERGVRMPGFFGYMLYTGCILLPVLVLLSLAVFVFKWFG
ncbi:MAG: sodium:proton antiporter [Phycisphaerae bacterium]